MYVLSAFLKAFAIIFLTAEFDKSLGVDPILFSCLVIADLLQIFDDLLCNCLRNAWFSLSFFTSPLYENTVKCQRLYFYPWWGAERGKQLQRDVLSSLFEILLRAIRISGYTTVLRLYNRYASLVSISSFCFLQYCFSTYNMKDTLPTQPKKFISFWQKKKTAKCVFFANYSQFSYAIFAFLQPFGYGIPVSNSMVSCFAYFATVSC